ncbi:hypothetical protein TIFTF001_029202 [Ficus carica]|uniref:Uncharacterized protein n=1 Tax=Ficus carica TaxID=3494 RepID=A0AA88J187_FICCA|nr:hypothetical protein TIFTF001_029202 [Ficus carica]
MISRMQYVVSTRVRSGLVHGLSWTGLAAPTTPWQRATVSKLIAILDTRQWSMAIQTVKLWDDVVEDNTTVFNTVVVSKLYTTVSKPSCNPGKMEEKQTLHDGSVPEPSCNLRVILDYTTVPAGTVV